MRTHGLWGFPFLGIPVPCPCSHPTPHVSVSALTEVSLQVGPTTVTASLWGTQSSTIHSQWRGGEEPEGSINYKVKQTRKKPSGSKLNHVKG